MTAPLHCRRAGRICFVTGATGFVALNIVDELLRTGWEVHALHRAGSARAKMLHELPHAAAGAGLILVEGDLVCPPAVFTELVPDGCDVIYHICHVAERELHPGRLLSAPGFQPEGAAEHKQVSA
jgi:nucleoside-diphosphate-sugar epimerase